MKKFIFWMLSALTLTMVSCRPQQPNYIDVKLATGEDITTSLKFEGRSEPLSIVVDAGMKWFTKISADDDWLQIEPAAGLEGKTEAKIIVNDKINDGARRATIQFMMIGSSLVREVEIIQKGGFDYIQLTDLDENELVSPVEFEETQTTVPFMITSGRRWSVKVLGGDTWLKVKPDRGIAGTTQLELAVEKNQVEEARKAVLRFTLVGGKNLTYDVEVNQKAHVKEEVKPLDEKDILLDIEFGEDGSAKDLSIYKMEVEHIAGAGLMNYYNDLYGKTTAHFTSSPGSAIS